MANVDRRFLDVRFTIDGVLDEPPASPVANMQVLVSDTPVAGSAFDGKANQIAVYTGSKWKFYTNFDGQFEVYNLVDKKLYRYESPDWVGYKVGSNDEVSDYIIKKVDDVIEGVGTAAPIPGDAKAAGDVFIDTTAGTIYHATGAGTWDSGTAAVEGVRYAYGNHVYEFISGAFTDTVMPPNVIFSCKSDDNLYSYDDDTGALINLTSVEDRPEYFRRSVTETILVDATAVADKKVVLSHNAVTSLGALVFVAGVVQVPGDDFELATKEISWNGKGLENFVMEDDKIVVSYTTEDHV